MFVILAELDFEFNIKMNQLVAVVFFLFPFSIAEFSIRSTMQCSCHRSLSISIQIDMRLSLNGNRPETGQLR